MFGLTNAEVARLALTLLGGGVLGHFVAWIRTSTSERRGLRASFLRDQLRRLYGPLHFHCSQNRALADHWAKLTDAYQREYCGKNWSDDPVTQANLDRETTSTIDIKNKYGTAICENNNRIVRLLRDNFDLVALDDVGAFQEFVLHACRHDVEYGNGGLTLPLCIYKHAGDVINWDYSFFERVASRFAQIQQDVQSLQRPLWFRRRRRRAAPVGQPDKVPTDQ